ncbi:MAG: alpha/beta fold hydrolase [Bacteroidales bacterium]|nr:alpha/beta fold hydrolase [Bacteroidales bacterium]
MKKIFFAAFLLLGILPLSFAQTGTWSGDVEVQGMKLGIVFHLDEENPTMDVPDQSATGLPIELSRPEAGKVSIKIPSIAASYEGQLQDGKIVGTFSQMGASLPLTLSPGVRKLNRPQTPVGPFPYAQEEVSFTSGDAVLKGTLVLPEGYTRQTPVLVMVSGSGLQNRDEEIMEHKPFAVIADALARAGYATLRYDDRGFGESTGDGNNASTYDFRDDALAAITLLRQRFDKVGVVGHSEGGTIALMLAADKQADFIVSLAGMAISGEETLIWQTDLALAAAGVAQDDIEKYNKLLSESYEAVRSGKELPSPAGRGLTPLLEQSFYGVMPQMQTPYLKGFITLDVRPTLDRITCPVLALNGTKDQQVKPESNLGALREGLKGNPKATVKAVEGLNHLFQHSETGQMTEYRDIEETFAPEVLDVIISWLGSLK